MPAPIKTALRRIMFLLLLYSLVRLCFLLNNWPLLKNESLGDLLFALVHGVRFDLSIILTINLIFIALWISPLRLHSYPWFKKTLHVLFVAVNFVFLAMNMVDTELVNFNARRMTWAYFNLKQDMGAQLPQIIANYWHWSLITGAMIPVMLYWTPKRLPVVEDERPTTVGGRLKVAVLYLAFIFALVVGIRGGLQNKPVREAHAFRGSVMLGHLTLNTPFTVIHSRKKSAEKEIRFYSDKEVREILRNGIGGEKPVALPQKNQRAQNVVLIILESFAREYMGAVNGRSGYTPFLDQLTKESLFFTNHFANARRSIEAIPALVAGLPSLLREPFLLSSYQGTEVQGLAQVLASHGYATSFFHGAENGSMFFDSFAKRTGYDSYFGMSEYPEPKKDWDGFWGILDGPFFQFFAVEMSKAYKKKSQPFFTTIFTLSSHQPYPVPNELKDQFPVGTLEIHRSVGYTDYSLKKFFKTAEKEPWFDQTLFVITADHTQKSDDPQYANLLGPYRVPLLFYQKNAPWAGQVSERITQHVDVMASILDYLGYQDGNIVPHGQSVFSDREGVFVAREVDSFIFHSKDCTARMSLEGEWRPETHSSGCTSVHERYLKAYVQSFINGVIKNNLLQ